MQFNETVLFVSAGLLAPKKRDHALVRRQLFLNYGALTLASQLDALGFPARLVHGGHEAPESIVRGLVSGGLLPSRQPVMLSIPSFYALQWAQEFCREVRRVDPQAIIVVGGRWVVGDDPDWLKLQLPEANVVVPGLAEGFINRYLNHPLSSEIPPAMPLPNFVLNHRLVRNYKQFQPSLETSRGCGMKCAFCEERDVPLTPLRNAGQLAEHFMAVSAQYDYGDIRPYLQSSFFAPGKRWAADLKEEMRVRDLAVAWRCETRVDGITPQTVQELSGAGMRVVDLGLESASIHQIKAMKKSSDPARYLRKASELIRACKDSGVWVKLNILLYAGETLDTLRETEDWLTTHAESVKGLSVGPVVIYGAPSQASKLLEDFHKLGGRSSVRASSCIPGVLPLHLSSEIDAQTAESLSLDLSRQFMDADAYYDLKSFSYYPRQYSRADFDRDVKLSDPSLLPFRVSR